MSLRSLEQVLRGAKYKNIDWEVPIIMPYLCCYHYETCLILFGDLQDQSAICSLQCKLYSELEYNYETVKQQLLPTLELAIEYAMLCNWQVAIHMYNVMNTYMYIMNQDDLIDYNLVNYTSTDYGLSHLRSIKKKEFIIVELN